MWTAYVVWRTGEAIHYELLTACVSSPSSYDHNIKCETREVRVVLEKKRPQYVIRTMVNSE